MTPELAFTVAVALIVAASAIIANFGLAYWLILFFLGLINL